jgi:AhpC/TSA family
MTLQDELNAYKAAPKPNFRPEFGLVIGRTIAALVASGQAGRALKAGDRAPAFDLPDHDGAVVSSADLLKRGPVVLTFYRGVWCPFCNIELKALQVALREIEAYGATLVAISQQTQANTASHGGRTPSASRS